MSNKFEAGYIVYVPSCGDIYKTKIISIDRTREDGIILLGMSDYGCLFTEDEIYGSLVEAAQKSVINLVCEGV